MGTILRWIVPILISTHAASAQPEATSAFRKLLDDDWEYTLRRSPEFASSLGDRRYNDRWTDWSLSAVRAREEHDRHTVSTLAAIDRLKLTPQDQINYGLFRRHKQRQIHELEEHWYLLPVDQRSGLQTADEIALRLRFTSTKDYEDWIARLRALAPLTDQTIGLMREGMRTKMLQPKVILNRVPAQIDKQIVSKPEDSLFYKPFLTMPANISVAEQARLKEQAAAAITNVVVPSFVRFKKFFTEEYLPVSFDQVGVWQVPEGDKIYATRVRDFTTTDLTPQEVHELGLKEVARIRAEMERVKASAGFTGSLKDFFAYLRSDSKFFYSNGAELHEGYRAMAKRIDPLLIKLFKTLPRTPYGVDPVPAAIAPDTTTAYYQPPAADGSRAGIYYVNLYRPEVRPKWEMAALTLHESVPGHHLQIALAQEQGAIPNFRRYTFFTAFVEGWGLYAESLGDEIAMYDDPYAKFGQLTYEMWRAVRLVVDTGMHAFHWDRQKAIDYFMENAPKTELDITNEIDRYIAWPGQALAYKIGELKFKDLRARAQKDLGAKFDVREFHDELLRNGSLPMDVLEQHMAGWIQRKQ
jgi:uncharacterized protein (DUF885 family)